MNQAKNEHEMFQEFADFVETGQVAPGKQLDESILSMIGKDLRPAMWTVLGKLTLVEVTAGLATLTICPQFGLRFGQHNPILHALHTSTSPTVFYLFCGLFFVIFGAILGGLILNRAEILTVGNNKYPYFLVYSILAYILLTALSPEVFVVSSLIWILGALLGNILGFAVTIRLRQATT
ncbi:hypothetical protein [Geopsychrobacter electrodiphilus]|uniref:hypothetical protein n=1 Tax=Geopsychrobacter electrodiphilus TaxID=225196 RepID=UPI00035D8CA3|nr:hypothetical protein [Geopsychrobacter electrodiphilus]